ncbi:MAG: NAD(+) diphosphatase [Gammaproteobacteria bacterium]|nr:NAD(+) diphosphatase [Gammaproteobacteria bacterium]
MFYTTQPLERADHLRKEAATIDAYRRSDQARLVPYHRGLLLIDTRDTQTPRVATLAMQEHDHEQAKPVFLGLQQETPYFALDLSAHEHDSIATPGGCEWVDLRRVGPQMAADEGAILAYTRAMMHWQQNSHFCSVCGHANGDRHAGHVRVCSNSDCAREFFPRTDPAVIMLVVHQPTDGSPERCLLGRNPAWPNGVYSTLAGFVEPGETLEHAVAREVLEEAGVVVSNVTYVASQPWPFPQSIMLGFHALAQSTDITLDPAELADAAWFTKDELTTFGNWGDDRFERQLPRPDSIARFLINSWLEGSVRA